MKEITRLETRRYDNGEPLPQFETDWAKYAGKSYQEAAAEELTHFIENGWCNADVLRLGSEEAFTAIMQGFERGRYGILYPINGDCYIVATDYLEYQGSEVSAHDD